jgi:hypothetical protein
MENSFLGSFSSLLVWLILKEYMGMARLKNPNNIIIAAQISGMLSVSIYAE